ncbi:hypothetical protein ACFXTH_003017 [Malus domestica]
MATATQMSKKRKFVANGVFFTELNEVLTRELTEDGYSGVEVRGMRIRELTSVVQKRFKFPENSVELYAEKVNNRGLCAIAQAESLRYKLLGGLAVRRMLPGDDPNGCEFATECWNPVHTVLLASMEAKMQACGRATVMGYLQQPTWTKGIAFPNKRLSFTRYSHVLAC